MNQYSIEPHNLYNMEEKGFLMGTAMRYKVICRSVRRTPKLTQDGSRDWVTVIEAISGDGRALPPMVINKGTAHYMGSYAYLKKKHKAVFGVSPTGWSNEKLGLRWLSEVFDTETKNM